MKPILLFNIGEGLYIQYQPSQTDHLHCCLAIINNHRCYMNMCASPIDGNRVHQGREKWQMLPHRAR